MPVLSAKAVPLSGSREEFLGGIIGDVDDDCTTENDDNSIDSTSDFMDDEYSSSVEEKYQRMKAGPLVVAWLAL